MSLPTFLWHNDDEIRQVTTGRFYVKFWMHTTPDGDLLCYEHSLFRGQQIRDLYFDEVDIAFLGVTVEPYDAEKNVWQLMATPWTRVMRGPGGHLPPANPETSPLP